MKSCLSYVLLFLTLMVIASMPVVKAAHLISDGPVLQQRSFDRADCDITAEPVFMPFCGQTCFGGIAILVTSGTPPFTFAWSSGETDSLITGLCEGDYFLTITDADGCEFMEVYTVYDFNPLFVELYSSEESSLGTNDGYAWVDPHGGTPPFSYAWSNGSIDAFASNLTSGFYSVTVTDSLGCTAEGEVFVTRADCIMANVVEIHAVSCYSECDGALLVDYAGGGPYQFLWNNGDTTALTEGLCADRYSVLIANEAEGCLTHIFYDLTQPEYIDANVDELVHITDSTVASISITPFNGTPPYTFSWSGPGLFMSSEEDLYDIPAGIYSVIITDANGCEIILEELEILDETVSLYELPMLQGSIYPNPAKDLVQIKLDDVEEFIIQLYGSDGRVLRLWNTEYALDMRDFGPGMYVMKIISPDQFGTYRLILEE